MDHSIPNAASVANSNTLLKAQLRELFGRVAYAHKTHEKCADIYTQKLSIIKYGQIWLSAITTGSLLLAVFGDSKACTVVGAFLATILFGLNTYTKDYDLGKLAQRHVDAATKLWSAREAYLSLLTDFTGGTITEEDARQQRDDLQKKLEAIYQSAPRTTDQAYGAAQKALQVSEELTFTDEEIDKFLPEPLRRGKQSA